MLGVGDGRLYTYWGPDPTSDSISEFCGEVKLVSAYGLPGKGDPMLSETSPSTASVML